MKNFQEEVIIEENNEEQKIKNFCTIKDDNINNNFKNAKFNQL